MKHSDLFIYNKDVPRWDAKKLHFYDQSLEVIDFYTEEFRKCIEGVTIGGVWFHPWLYFHMNFFKTPIPLKNGTEPIIEPFLRDNEWYVAEMFKKAQDAGKNIFMFGTRRFAKALRDDQILFLVNGVTKPIGKAVVGDVIFGSDGLPTTILEVAPQGKKELYEVHLEDGRVSVCCEDHLWTVYNKHGNKNVYDLGTIIKKTTKSNPFYISNTKAVQYKDVPLSISPYEIGNRIGNRQSVDIDDDVFIASVEQKEEFIKGLIESEVKFLKRCEKYIKIELYEDTHIDTLLKIFRSVGYEAKVVEDGDVFIFMFTNKRSSLVRIKDIVKVEPDYATCIMVDNESKEFLTNDYIVTHNSVMETSMIHWSAITKPNTTSEIICGAAEDLNQVTRFLRLSTTNINPAFRMPTTKNDYGKHVQFGYRESRTGSVIAYSDIFIKNADSGKDAASEKGAGGAPILVILDEALEENTLLITGSGKVPIKDINIGDEIYDDSGKLTVVEDKIKFENRQLFKIEFSDGRSIEACENHLWEVYKNGNANKPYILTTKEIADKVFYLKYDHRYNKDNKYFINSVKICKPLEYEEIELPLEPYFVGLYLGDGFKNNGAIGTKDVEIKEYLKEYAKRIGMTYSEKENSKKDLFFKVCSLVNSKGKKNKIREALRGLGIFKEKSIPSMYLKGSVNQRLELLRGLMDTDGTIGAKGTVSFSSSNALIVEGMKELLYSLGIRFSTFEKIGKYKDKNGDIVLCKVNTQFNIITHLSLFSISYKKEREKITTENNKSKHLRDFVSIVDIKESKIGTAYCIKVDNDSKLFLAGDYIVTHNCGKYSFLKMYLGLLPALQTPHGQKGTVFLSGTSGNEKLSKDAFKVLSNPNAYNILPMDWSVLNDKVPKIYQTWSESTFGIFVPGQMSYETGLIKKESNLAEYLGSDNKELKKVNIQVTDWKVSTQILKDKRIALEKDRESYNKQVMYFPLDPNDCFLSGMSTPFPVHTGRLHMNTLVEKGEIGKAVEIFKKDGNVLGYELSSLPRVKFPFEGGIHDAPVLLYGEPPEILPEKHEFVSGLDPYKAKEANTPSVGSFHMIKRKLDLKQPIEIIVASYASRPSTQKKFNRTCEYLIEGWNSECLMENADQSIIQYLEDKNKMYLLAEGIEWSKMINPNTKARTTTGYAPTPKNQAYVFSLVVDYCNTEIDTGVLDVNGEPIIKLGIEYIPDIELLQEIIDWKNGMNADRIVSFGSALAWARYLDKLRVIPRVRTELDERTKRDAEKRKAEAKARAFSKVTTVLRK